MDNSDLKEERQREQLEALYQLSLELGELRDLQQVLDLALNKCLTLTGSQFGFIGLNSPDSAAMDVVALQGIAVSRRFYDEHHLLMPLRSTLLSRVAVDNQPERSADATSDPRRVGQPAGHPPVQMYLGVPLRRRSLPLGMIGVANRSGGYTEEQEQLLMTYAGQVAIAIHNSQLYGELKVTKESLERAMLAQYVPLRSAQSRQELGLTDDDIRVLEMVASGANNQEISRRLHWSVGSVKRRTQRIFQQLGVTGRAPAAAEAVRRGLI